MKAIFNKPLNLYKTIVNEIKNITWSNFSQVIWLAVIITISILIISIFSGIVDFFVEKIIFFLLKLKIFS